MNGVEGQLKPVVWVGSSLDDLRAFPEPARRGIGRALQWAQRGGKHPDAKPLRGFGGASVLEIVEDFDGDTYRAVYTVRLAGRVYALHCFRKKATRGIKTARRDLDLIRQRLREAEVIHRASRG